MSGPANAPAAGTGRAIRTVSGLTVLSRCFGLARDLVTVRIFGDTAVGSAFAAAFAIPNLFRRLFGEGALSAAFLPAYARLLKHEPETAHALASLVIGVLAAITGAIALAGGAGLLALVFSLEPDADRTLSLLLVVVMLPYMPLICVAAILGGMLQAHGRFAPWAAAPIILNSCILIAGVPFFFVEGADPGAWAYRIGAAVVVAGVVQAGWSVWMLRGRAQWTTRVARAKPEAAAMFRRMGPALIGLGTLQINSMLDTLIAMWPNWVGPTVLGVRYPLDEASNAVLFYAQRLYQFPLGVFGIAVATVIFPELARRAGDNTAFMRTLRHGVRLSLFIALPASVGLALVRTDLVHTVYTGLGRGFSEDGVARAARVVLGYSVAVWSYSLMHVFTRAFYAAGDTRTPMFTAFASVALNLTLNLLLIWPMREAGLAWSTAISSIFQLTLLALLARRRLLGGMGLLDRETRASVVRTVGMSIAMGLAVAAVVVLWPRLRIGDWLADASGLAASVVVGAAVYAAAARRTPEMRWLLAGHDETPDGDTDDRHTPEQDGE